MKPVEPKDILIFENTQGKNPFKKWLNSLQLNYRSRIEQRLLRVSLGNYGDYKCLQDGVSELRFTFGPGYRVYFGEDGNKIVVLLCGGDKSTQERDINKAIEYWREYKDG